MALSSLYFLTGIMVGPLFLPFLPLDYQSCLPSPLLYAWRPLLQLPDLTFHAPSVKNRFFPIACSSLTHFPRLDSIGHHPTSGSVQERIHDLSDLISSWPTCFSPWEFIFDYLLFRITHVSGVFFIQTLILAQYFYCCFVFRHLLRCRT